MPDPGADPRGNEAPGLAAALGTFAGFALLALTAAVCIAVGVPRAPGGLGLRAAHQGFEIACTLGLGALYPWLSRPDAWLGATWQYPWLLLVLVVVPVVWWWGTFGQDKRKPRLRVGTVSPLLQGPRGLRTHLRDLPGVLRAAAHHACVDCFAR